MKPIILVTGATGAQGGSVARALLADNKFAVRIFTRNPNSPKVLELEAAGAIVYQGDLDDKASLNEAMEGCYGVFGLTNFWEHYGNEYQQGINLIDAVHRAGIRHFVLHTLPGYSALSNGKYEVPHCDIKAKLQEYANQLELPATFIHVAFYYENFFNFFPPQIGENGQFYFGFPQGNTPLAMVSVEDVGKIVAKVFDYPETYIGRTIGAVGADEPCETYAAMMTKILDKEIRYNYIPRDTYAAFGFPGAEELANMFEVQRLFIPNRKIHLIESYGLNPEMQSFENWLIKNKSKLVAMLAEQEIVPA